MPAPRMCNFMCRAWPNTTIGKTWLESEAFCYPRGGMHRRFLAWCPDGKLHLGWCGIPDTVFSIPAVIKWRGKLMQGWVGVGDRGYEFRFNKE